MAAFASAFRGKMHAHPRYSGYDAAGGSSAWRSPRTSPDALAVIAAMFGRRLGVQPG